MLVQARAAEVQRLQFFLSEAAWDGEAINAKRLVLLATAPSAEGVLVIDDTGDRKDGCATDHVARQYLGSVVHKIAGRCRAGCGHLHDASQVGAKRQRHSCGGTNAADHAL